MPERIAVHVSMHCVAGPHGSHAGVVATQVSGITQHAPRASGGHGPGGSSRAHDARWFAHGAFIMPPHAAAVMNGHAPCVLAGTPDWRRRQSFQ